MTLMTKPLQSITFALAAAIGLLLMLLTMMTAQAAESPPSEPPRRSSEPVSALAPEAAPLQQSLTCLARVSDGLTDSPIYTSVQAAIEAVTAASNTVKVAGYCDETVETLPDFYQIAFISQPLTLRGGYTTTNWAVSDPVAHPTIFDALSNDRIMVISGTSGVRVENLMLINGYNSDFPGAGVYVVGADAVISHTQVYSSRALYGGGILLESGQLTLSGVELRGNTTSNEGGAIYTAGQLTVTDNSLIHNNSAGLGGGIVNEGELTVEYSTVASNTATTDGGGIANLSLAVLTMTHSTVSYNQAGDTGGGVANNGNVYLLNSTLSTNRATNSGGGLFESETVGALKFTTVASNTAAAGSGLYLDSGVLNVSNSLIANNQGGSNCSGSITSGGHNLADDSSCNLIGTGDVITAPSGLEPLQLNAPGKTQTHGLSNTSPAIDAGQCIAGVTTDQRGAPRPQPDTAICDIGAYEAGVVYPAEIIVYSPDESTDVAEGGITDTLGVYLATAPAEPVTVNLTTDGQTTVSPTTLNFTTSDWNTAQSVTVTAVQDSLAEGDHQGRIDLTATSLDANYNGLTATTTANIEDDDFTADLAVIKTAPASLVLGDKIGYDIKVSNGGPDAATNLTITDTLPNVSAQTAAQLAPVISYSVRFDPPRPPDGPQLAAAGISCGQTGLVFSCTVAELQANAVMNLSLELTPQANGTFVNTVQVGSATFDPNPANNSDTATTTVGTAVADLAVSKSVTPTSVTVGDPLTYTLHVTNTGPAAAFGVTIIDPLPPELLIASALASQGNCNISGGTVSCGVSSLAAQTALQITIVATSAVGFADPTVLTNTATVAAAVGSDPTATNNTAAAPVTIVPLIIETTVSPSLGGTLAYTDARRHRTEIIVPPGAVTDTIKLAFSPISISISPPTGLDDTGHGFTLNAFTYPAGSSLPDFAFIEPFTLTIEYDDSDIAEIEDESELRVYYFNGSAWQDVAETCTPVSVYQRDLSGNRLSVAVCHLTEFALFGPWSGSSTYVPLIIKTEP